MDCELLIGSIIKLAIEDYAQFISLESLPRELSYRQHIEYRRQQEHFASAKYYLFDSTRLDQHLAGFDIYGDDIRAMAKRKRDQFLQEKGVRECSLKSVS